MAARKARVLEPRKTPVQSRSKATVDAIFQATIQVLLVQGSSRLTTIRVAERAGVSVGTLYQYYPNKQALLGAVLEWHLLRVVATVEEAARSAQHTPLATMVRAVVGAYVAAKMHDVTEAQALYRVAGELDAVPLIRAISQRGHVAVTAMLETASDASFDDTGLCAYMFVAAMAGPSRAMLEGGASPAMFAALTPQLESLCLGYLEREARRRPAASAGTR